MSLPSFYPASELRREDGPQAGSEELLPTASDGPQEDSIQHGYETADSEDSVYSIDDPLENWYKDVGYLPALDESTFNILEQVLSPFAISEIKEQLYKSNTDRTLGLDDRNVRSEPCSPPDPFLTEFHNMKSLQESSSSVNLVGLHDEVKKYRLDEWRLDLEKAVVDQLDPTFQRTVMMSMLDRYRLIYSLKDENQSVLDFAIESTWNCPFMPTRALARKELERHCMLPRPKPDITVAFRLQSIVQDGARYVIPDATRRIMAYEGLSRHRAQRVFHFLMVDAKNAEKTSNDRDGQIQSLNSASQSLHCLYEFFNEADRRGVECNKPCCTPGAATSESDTDSQGSFPTGEDTFVGRFFKEVRVFTAVLAGNYITIRVHRACPASPSPFPFPSCEGRPPFMPSIIPDYPLQFEYNELATISGDEFSRERLVNTFEKIMVDYGIGQLRPLLQRAAETIATKFSKWQNENRGVQSILGMRHYSHGQTTPPPSAQTSRATGEATQRSSVSTMSTHQSLGPTRRASWSAPSDSRPARFSFTAPGLESPIEYRGKKRRRQ
ncbi:hypothetical protein GGR51DRAFT_501932 [Nemania sp. FL0031]|nr:hypothetical protein GGR51DRAFT_501932 [Nemania sp. FL0031]